MTRQLWAALRIKIVFTLLLGFAYTFALTGVAQVLFPSKANGSLVSKNGQEVGSGLLGQNFAAPQYFHPRPSAAGADGYDGTSSGGSQLGPTNPVFTDTVLARVQAYREENGLGPDVLVPSDAVTASGSGLDPDISVANAELQVNRVAQARTADPARVLSVVRSVQRGRILGFFGEPHVNVLSLNLALDRVLGSA